MGEQVAAGFMWGCSSVGRAPALQAGGQEFESLHLHSVSKDNKKDIRETDTATYLENRILKIKIILKRNIKTSEVICEVGKDKRLSEQTEHIQTKTNQMPAITR